MHSDGRSPLSGGKLTRWIAQNPYLGMMLIVMRTDQDDQNIGKLSLRERQVLTLLAQSHDAKSIARTLRLSIHTVNEQLRAARHKLGVNNSREAARILLASCEEVPKIVGDVRIGIAEPSQSDMKSTSPELRAIVVIAGACLMTLLALLALTISKGGSAPVTPAIAAPTVVAVSPSNNGAISPGPFLLTVTFDQPMAEGYSFVQMSSDSFPNCEHRPGLSADKRTFAIRCTAIRGKHYELWFNRPPYMNFRSLAGLPAQPTHLQFSVVQ